MISVEDSKIDETIKRCCEECGMEITCFEIDKYHIMGITRDGNPLNVGETFIICERCLSLPNSERKHLKFTYLHGIEPIYRHREKEVNSYYVDVFEKDGKYSTVFNEGEHFETLIKMKKEVILELRNKLNKLLI